MEPEQLDALARSAAAEAPRGEQASEPDLEALLAYRAGTLDAAETERVEAELAVQPAARRMLIDLAEPVPAATRAASRTAAQGGGHAWSRLLMWLLPVGLAAGAAMVLLLPAPGVALEVDLLRPVAGTRSLKTTPVAEGDLRVGDVLVVRTRSPAWLRVYGPAGLALDCTDEVPCRARGESVEAPLVLEAPGAYHVLVLSGGGGAPASTGEAKQDLSAAEATGWRGALREVRVQ